MSESRDEIMMNFQAMTNKTDLDECIAILESSNWDLNRAVSAALEELEESSNVEAIPSAESLHSATSCTVRNIPINVDHNQTPFVTFPSETDLENMMQDEFESISSINANPFSRLFDHTPLLSSSTSSSAARSTFRAINFRIERDDGPPLDIIASEADTVETLEAEIANRLNRDADFYLINWPTRQPDSDTVLRSLHLPRSVSLKLISGSEDVENDSLPVDGAALNRDYQLMLHDKHNVDSHTLTRRGAYSVAEVKQDAEDITGILLKQQVWTGWPPNIVDDMTLAACNLDTPMHHLYLDKAPNGAKPSMSTANQSSSAYISDDECDYYPENEESDEYPYNSSPIKVQSLPKRNTLPLIPENVDGITTGTVMFAQVFEARYGLTHPVFFEGNLEMAAEEAHRSERLLAIYLHHDQSIAANVFPSVVLCNSHISEMLTCQAVLWPWDMTNDLNSARCIQMLDSLSPDSSMVRSLDRCPIDQYPLLILVSVREFGRLSQPLAVISGADSAQMVQNQLQAAIAENAAQYVDARRQEQEREERDRFRKEQEKAYEESLAADRQRIEQREEEERREKKRVEKDQAELNRRDRLLASIETATKDSKSALTLRLRLPDGKAHDYRFEPEVKLKTLFDLIDGHGFAPETHTLDTNDKPKRQYTLDDADRSLDNCFSSKRELITVSQKIEEERDDDD